MHSGCQTRPSYPTRSFHLSIPNEITGAGLRASRGWKWWISRKILWLFFVLFRQRRHGRLVLERVRGIPIIVFPGVFHPVLFLSTPLLLDAIKESKLGIDSLVLDLGTGTGVCAIAAARMGAQVTATDISPIAVRCARANVLVNNLEDRIRVLEGDLFEPVGSERFDLVIFNLPYFKGKPVDWADYAWRGEGVFQRFLEGLSVHLTRRGKVLLSVSTELDLAAVKKGLLEKGFVTRETRKRRIPGEALYVYECAPSNP